MFNSIVLQNKTRYHSKYLSEDIYNLLDSTFMFPGSGFDFNMLEVPDEYIARPDLISIDAYGDPMYADIICKLNGISNPFELNAGTNIILPSPDSIKNFYCVVSLEYQEGMDDLLPKPKRRQDKRAPNEALIGDKRFKIDKNNGVIIY